VKFVLFAALGLVLLWWFAKDLNWSEVAGNVRGANWMLLAGSIALILSTYVIRALRWRTLLAPVCPNVRFSNLFAATALGFSAVFLAGRAGEIVRPVILSSKDDVRPSASFATIMIERIFDAVTVVALFAVNLLVFDTPLAGGTSLAPIRWAGGALLAASAAGIFSLVFLRRHRRGVVDVLNRHMARFGRTVRRAVVSFVSHFAEALSVLHDARELVIASAYSLLLWGICAVASLMTIRAFGLDTSLSEAIFVLGFSMVGSLVPTPGGAAGAFHTATAGGLYLLGVEENRAASIAIVLHLIAYGSALVFGVYFLMRGGISSSRLRAALSEDLNSQPDYKAATESSAPIGA
jgi:uncharacterized protein (TIRG00374 family)